MGSCQAVLRALYKIEFRYCDVAARSTTYLPDARNFPGKARIRDQRVVSRLVTGVVEGSQVVRLLHEPSLYLSQLRAQLQPLQPPRLLHGAYRSGTMTGPKLIIKPVSYVSVPMGSISYHLR